MKHTTQPALKIASINIQQDYHLHNRVLPFLRSKELDVILLQEVFLENLAEIASKLNMSYVYSPLNKLRREQENTQFELGVATFYRAPLKNTYCKYYRGSLDDLPMITDKNPEKMARCLLVTSFDINNQPFHFANTHFTWSPNGKVNDMQRKDLQGLFTLLDDLPECILAGDFNAPRGGEIFDTIAKRYKDNIPSHITTTLDHDLHKAGPLNLVVDGLFTSPKYKVQTLEFTKKISDHHALTAEISYLPS